MASSFSDYTENKVLELVCGKTAFTTPASYLGIWITNPNFETGAGGTPASTGGYGRKTVTWGTASGGSIANSTSAISWTCGTDIAANTYNGWSIFDAGPTETGNMLFGDTFGSGKTLASGDVLNFAVGSLTVTLT